MSRILRAGRLVLLGLALQLALPPSASSQDGLTAPPAFQPDPIGERASSPPPPLAVAVKGAPITKLLPADEAVQKEIDFIRFWNGTGRIPAMNGTSRPLPAARVSFDALEGKAAATDLAGGVAVPLPDGRWAWTATLEVEKAYRLRLKLEEVALPPGAELWVHGSEEEGWIGPFGAELRSEDGVLWTPSVTGPSITVVAAFPAEAPGDGGWGFRPGAVMELFPLDGRGAPISTPKADDLSCLKDATCFGSATLDVMELYRSAVAHLQYIKNGGSYICSGGLVNDNDSATTIPYFLTANHCMSTQTVASTLEAFWNYRTPICGGSWPSLGSLPRSLGATLLATSVQTDFSFLRLNSIPAGRTLLGWSTSTLTNGTVLHRLSHPAGLPQAYSQSTFLASPNGTCSTDSDGRPWGDLSKFAYSSPTVGHTVGGSSGAPVLLAGGYIVGQLLGGCGFGVDEPCVAGASVRQVDGRFSATYPAISQWLNPASAGGACTRNATTACLVGNRFEVKVDWTTSTMSGAAQVQSFGGQRAESDESVFWWFFAATNFEMGVKVLNACGLNNRFWVFGSGLTDQGWTVRVRDTQTGAIKTYSNTLGRLSTTFADTSAFSCT